MSNESYSYLRRYPQKCLQVVKKNEKYATLEKMVLLIFRLLDRHPPRYRGKGDIEADCELPHRKMATTLLSDVRIRQ